MSRLQLALNVDNFDESVEFYSKLFATEPANVSADQISRLMLV